MTDVLRAGRFAVRYRRRSLIVDVVIAVLVLATVLAALLLGKYGLSPADLWSLVDGSRGKRVELTFDRRIRRATAAVFFGACLGVSGMLFQSLTRNPLGSPDVIGLNSGAYTGVVAALTFGATGYAALTAGAIVGSIVAAALVFVLSYPGSGRLPVDHHRRYRDRRDAVCPELLVQHQG